MWCILLKLLLTVTIKALLVSTAISSDDILPVRKTQYGEVRGSIMKSRNGKSFAGFRGIPYAQPPVGSLRFAPPKEVEKWNGIRNATEDSPICIQQDFLFKRDPPIEGSEDCLYINVYTPKGLCQNKKKSGLLPVIFFIHYGGFVSGNARSDIIGPDYIMDNDVVLVTFNYRLGIMGFFSTYDDAAPGNWAFKDQLAALRWVNNNIQYFGGNNKKITIMGQSAGAGSVHHLMLSPSSKGLFQAAVTMSGTALALWAKPVTKDYFFAITNITAISVGCDSEDTNKMIECLREIPANDLVNVANVFRLVIKSEPLTPYFPSIEQKTANNPEPFITEDPFDIIAKGNFHNVPWLVGVTSGEGILRTAPFVRQDDVRAKINSNFDALKEFTGINLSVGPEMVDSLWAQVNHYYFNGRDNLDNAASITGLIDLYSDRAFQYPAYQAVRLHKRKGHKSIYVYNFNYRGKYSYGDLFAGTANNTIGYKWGVSHCDDLLYILSSPGRFPDFELSELDSKMSDIMLNLFMSFVKYGDPTPEHLWNSRQPWEAVPDVKNSDLTQEGFQFLDISGSLEEGTYHLNMSNGFYSSRMHFWESKPLFENKHFSNLTSLT